MSRTTDAESEAPWQKFLSRWALLTALAVGALLVAFTVVLQFDSSVPPEYAGLVMASRQPGAFRFASMLDILLELTLGGLLVAFAGLLWRRAPIRSALVALCAAGQVANLIGEYIDLRVTSDLAARYATAGAEQQAVLIQTYRTVELLHEASFNAGAVLYGGGLLLIASVGLRLVGFPRWLAAWIGLMGVYGLGERLFFIVTGTTIPFFPVGFLVNIVGNGLLYVAIAVTFWRRQPDAVTARRAEATA
jgi:hypothetical protein